MKNFGLAFLLASLIFTVSCGKKNIDYLTRNGAETKALITVVNSDGTTANNVSLQIYHEEQRSILNDPNTQSEQNLKKSVQGGQVEFDLSFLYRRGSVGVATVNVAAYDNNGANIQFRNNNDSRLVLEPEKENLHTIVLNN